MRTHTLEVMDDDGDLMQFETNSEDSGAVAITWSIRVDGGLYTQIAALTFDIDDVREINNFLEIACRNHIKSELFRD
jgi:hypothetical protein